MRSPYDKDIFRLAVPALGALAAEPLYVLVDTAIGRKEPAKFRDLYGIENDGAASISSKTEAASAETQGRRITQPVHRLQNRDCVVSGRRDQCRYDVCFAAALPKGSPVSSFHTALAMV